MCRTVSSLALTIFNGFIFLLGIGVMLIGAISTWKSEWITDIIQRAQSSQANLQVGLVIENSMYHYGLAIFIMGSAILIISILGICGSSYRSRCLLAMYVAFTGIVALALIVEIISLSSYNNRLDQFFRSEIQKLKDRQGNLDQMERTLKCCGVTNAREEYPNNNYPNSCCNMPTCNQMNAYPMACDKAIAELTKDGFFYFLISLVILFSLFVLSAIISVILIKRLKPTKEVNVEKMDKK